MVAAMENTKFNLTEEEKSRLFNRIDDISEQIDCLSDEELLNEEIKLNFRLRSYAKSINHSSPKKKPSRQLNKNQSAFALVAVLFLCILAQQPKQLDTEPSFVTKGTESLTSLPCQFELRGRGDRSYLIASCRNSFTLSATTTSGVTHQNLHIAATADSFDYVRTPQGKPFYIKNSPTPSQIIIQIKGDEFQTKHTITQASTEPSKR